MRKGILFLLFMCAAAASAQTTLDKIVAVVDKEIITLSDLNFTVQQVAIQNKVDPASPEVRDQVLDGMINDKLILAQAIQDSVIVTEDEVSETLNQQIQQLVYRLGSEAKLEEAYGMSVGRIKRDYQFREQIRKKLLVQKVQQQRQASLSVSRRDVEEFYQQYKDSIPNVPTEFELSHIYIEPKPDASALKAIYDKALAVADSIRAGGDFADFARRYSSDATASQGGDLGFARRGSFVKEYEEVAFTLRDSEISNPVRTQFGYHIIQLLERRGDAVHTRHILFPIKVSQANDDSAIALLNKIRDSVLAGGNFGLFARKYSEDNDTKDIGGDLGRVSIDQLDPAYEDFVKGAKTGDISEPRKITVGNKYGYHIILVRSVTPEHAINLQQDYKRLEQLALQFKMTTNYQEWVEELRKTVYWEKKL